MKKNRNIKRKKKEFSNQNNTINYIYILIIMVLLICLSIRNNMYIIPSVILVIMLIMLNYYEISKNRKNLKNNFVKLTEDMNIATQNMLVNSPFSMLIADESANIIWKSKKFNSEINEKEAKKKISMIIQKTQMDIENGNNRNNEKLSDIHTKVEIDDNIYLVIGNFLKIPKKNIVGAYKYIYTLYFLNNTRKEELKRKYDEEKLMISFIKIDNYEEIISKIVSSEKSRILSEIDRIIYNWSAKFNGLVIKNDTENYIILFQKRYLEKIKEDKFSILNDVKKIYTTISIPATLSISLSEAGEELENTYVSSKELLDIILGRGGDQAGIVIDGKMKFYGGKTKEVEKLTKVKSRVISKKLANKAKLSSNIIIMGHKNIDIDALGSAIGLRRFFSEFNNNTYIASNIESAGLGEFKNIIKENEEYDDIILTKQEALQKINKDTLLVVVDVHRKEFTEFPELVENSKHIALIDHHRKLVDYIENVEIEYHEVYASSTSELVTEIIEYSEKNIELSSFEAEALYGGILVDTKNFTFKTGVRTFEAAAYLRKFGIDIIRVKKYFETNLDGYMNIYDIIKNTKMISEKIAIARNEKKSTAANLECAKAADQMLKISDIAASITYGYDGKVMQICLRSLGDINMQLIAEKLGGGGHMTLAGAQIETDDYDAVEEKIINAVKEYYEETVN